MRDGGKKKGDEKSKRSVVRMFWLSALAILAFFVLYRYVVSLVSSAKLDYMWLSVLMWAYLILGCADFVAIFFLQRGFSNKPLSADDLPDSMSLSEKRAYLESDAKRKRVAKYLFIPLVAIIFVFLFEIIDLYYIPAIKSWFSR